MVETQSVKLPLHHRSRPGTLVMPPPRSMIALFDPTVECVDRGMVIYELEEIT